MLKTVLFTLLFTLGASVANGQVLLGILFGDKLASEKFHIGLTSAEDVYDGVISHEITIKADRKDMLNSTDAGVTFVLEYKVG